MPELPEVETIVRQLAKVLLGKVIASVEVLNEKSVRGQSVSLVDKKILSVERKQKMIVMELKDDLVLLIHLKMTGQLIYLSKGDRVAGGSSTTALARLRLAGGHPTKDWTGKLPSKHTRATIQFTDKSKLFFNDQRMFGWVKIVDRQEWLGYREKMAPDVVDEAFTVAYLGKVVGRSGRAIKLVILDQDKMGGMGNIYACDGLYLARINPQRKANSLKPSEILRLHEAMKRVIAKGIETGGASYSHYVDTKGLGGHYQEHFLVYNQEGKLCQKCHQAIVKISIGGRGTYFCPKCQR